MAPLLSEAHSKSTVKKEDNVKRRKCGSKTRTGCITCKIRHVKCDELKPACSRCTSTGRKCDGYPTILPYQSKSHTANSTTLIATSQLTLLPKSPFHIPGTSQEKRSFQFFVQSTVTELTGYFPSEFWERIILQGSEGDETLRHGLVALGSLHEGFRERRNQVGSLLLNGEAIEGLGAGGENTGFAVNQYTKAISSLRQSLSTSTTSKTHQSSPLIVLTSCIIFACFDSLRGSFETAMLHLLSGIRILHDLRVKNTVTVSERNIIEKNIVPVLERLSIQSVLYIDTRSDEERIRFAKELGLIYAGAEAEKRITEESEEGFKTLEEARESLNRAAGGLFRMFYACTGGNPIIFQPSHALSLYESSLQALRSWDHRFTAFLTTSSSNPKISSSAHLRANALLKIHHTTVMIMASAIPPPKTTLDLRSATVVMNTLDRYTPYLPLFKVIISLSRSLVLASESDERTSSHDLNTSSSNIPKSRPTGAFSTDLGIIAPLYFTCTKCTDWSVRKEAFLLLKRCRRREGMWDSAVAVELVRGFWEVETKHGLWAEGVGRCGKKMVGKDSLRSGGGEGVEFGEMVDLELDERGQKWVWRFRGENGSERGIGDGNGHGSGAPRGGNWEGSRAFWKSCGSEGDGLGLRMGEHGWQSWHGVTIDDESETRGTGEFDVGMSTVLESRGRSQDEAIWGLDQLLPDQELPYYPQADGSREAGYGILGDVDVDIDIPVEFGSGLPVDEVSFYNL